MIGNKEHNQRHSQITSAKSEVKDTAAGSGRGSDDGGDDLKPIHDFVFVGLITLMDPPRLVCWSVG